MNASLRAVFLSTLLVSPVQASVPSWTEGSSLLYSTSSSQLSKADPVEFYLYGGPGSLEGTFETAGGDSDWQDWTSHDPTYGDPFWQVSTFHAENLDDQGPGNHAYWCGRTAEQEPTWACPPGYGNNWDTSIEWRSGPLADPSVGQTVGLDFFYNLNSETGYDYFYVEYDSAGTWMSVFQDTGTHFVPPFDASNGYPAPGARYSLMPAAPIVYEGGDYGGPGGDEIRLRIRVRSDCCHSAEDCFFINEGGFLHVDDVTVTYGDGVVSGLTDFSDFEGPPPYSWLNDPDRVAFGDFTKLYDGLTDLDPCSDNSSWQVTFLDDGTPPNNFPPEGTWVGTGSMSANWSYGAPGSWTVPRVSSWDPSLAFHNEIWSPSIAWDLPGTADDAAQHGAILALDVWSHLPVPNGMFWTHRIRSSTDGTVFGPWEAPNPNYVYYGTEPRYERREFFLGDLVPPDATHVQVALRAVDLAAVFGFPGNDETPSPWFDNVSLRKFATGPYIRSEARYLFQDAFPPSGSIDTSSPENLACRLDMADIDGPCCYGNGDSLVVDIQPLVPGTTLQGPVMHWILDANPRFEAVRTMPAGAILSPGAAAHGWDQWSGVLAGIRSSPGLDRFAFDLPNESDDLEHMFFPGDFFRYYIEAMDSGGNVTTLPHEIAGFADGIGYDGQFKVRALPTIVSDGQADTQPRILLVNDSGLESIDPYRASFEWLGLTEGVGFDAYTVRQAGGNVGNAIGTPGGPGPTVDQLAGYDCILYELGDNSRPYLPGYGPFRDDDLGVLSNWHGLPGDRFAAHFGDGFVVALQDNGSSGSLYAQDVLAADLFDPTVADEIGGQLAPPLVPIVAPMQTMLVANGGCPQPLGIFESLRPLAPAVVGHEFGTPGGGSTYSGPAASVIHDRLEGIDRRVDVTFAFGLASVERFDDPGSGVAGRAELLRDLFAYFGTAHVPPVGVEPTELPPRPGMTVAVSPNPFNPVVTIEVGAPARAHYSLTVYDVRGQRVATLVDGELEARRHVFRWQGLDDGGEPVASGVYLAVLESAAGQRRTAKMALLR